MVTRDGNDPLPIDDAKAVCLQNVAIHHRLAEAVIANRIESMRMARRLGATWEEIGATLGMSRQSAHKKFAAQIE